MRLEERIMIDAEMPRCVLTMDGGVEHTADVGAIDGTTISIPDGFRVSNTHDKPKPCLHRFV